MSQTTIIPAAVQSYDSATHTTVVRPLGYPATALGPLPVAANIAPSLISPGARVLVLLYPDTGGAVIGVL